MGPVMNWAEVAERRVLGNLLEHSQEAPRVVDLVADRLAADDFATPEHRAVYGAVAELVEDGEPVSLSHVLRRLGRASTPKVGEALGLVVEQAYPRYSDRSLLGQVKLIRAASRARKTRELGQEITEAAGAEDGERALQGAYERMLRLATEGENDQADDEGPFIDEAAERLRAAGEDDRGLIRTGIGDLDRIFPTGLAPRTLTVIAALTSRGKTALAVQVADRLALEIVLHARRGLVRLLSLEMGRVELHRRRLIALTGIPMDEWLGRKPLPPNADAKLREAVRELKDRPIAITYAGTMSLPAIKALARRDANTRGLACLVVDYLQLVELGRRSENRTQEVAAVAYGLKAIAMDHDVPVLAVAQLSRAAEGTATPKLSDLRESGGIEQAADNVIFVYQHPKDEGRLIMRLRIGKQRNGQRDLECRVFFDSARFRFEQLAEEGSPWKR